MEILRHNRKKLGRVSVRTIGRMKL